MKPTPAMIGAAHDVTMKEAGLILSHELITKIYEAMQAPAANDRRRSTTSRSALKEQHAALVLRAHQQLAFGAPA